MSAKNGFLEEQEMVELAERRSFSNRTEAPEKYSQRRGRRGVSHPLWLVKNDSKRDFAGRLAKKTSADEGVEECCYCLVELSHNLFDVEAWQHYRKLSDESFEIYCSEVLHISAEQAERLKLIRDRCLPPRGGLDRSSIGCFREPRFWQARRKTTISDNGFDHGTMKKNWCCKSIHVPPHVLTSLALSQYHFSTPEIRLLMRQILGYALSGRTIKRLAKSAGHRLKRGRPV